MKHLHEVLLVLASLSGGSIPRPPPELVPSLNNKNNVKQKTSQLPISAVLLHSSLNVQFNVWKKVLIRWNQLLNNEVYCEQSLESIEWNFSLFFRNLEMLCLRRLILDPPLLALALLLLHLKIILMFPRSLEIQSSWLSVSLLTEFLVSTHLAPELCPVVWLVLPAVPGLHGLLGGVLGDVGAGEPGVHHVAGAGRLPRVTRGLGLDQRRQL